MSNVEKPGSNREQVINQILESGGMHANALRIIQDARRVYLNSDQQDALQSQLDQIITQRNGIFDILINPDTIAELDDQQIAEYTAIVNDLENQEEVLNNQSNISDRFTKLEDIVITNHQKIGGVNLPQDLSNPEYITEEEKQVIDSGNLEADLLLGVISVENAYNLILATTQENQDLLSAKLESQTEEYGRLGSEAKQNTKNPEKLNSILIEMRAKAKKITETKTELEILSTTADATSLITEGVNNLKQEIIQFHLDGGIPRVWQEEIAVEQSDLPDQSQVAAMGAILNGITSEIDIPESTAGVLPQIEEQEDIADLNIEAGGRFARVDWKEIFGDKYTELFALDPNYTTKFCNALNSVAGYFDMTLNDLGERLNPRDPRVDYAVMIDMIETLGTNAFLEIFNTQKSNPHALRIISLAYKKVVGEFVEPENFEDLLSQIRQGNFSNETFPTIGQIVVSYYLESLIENESEQLETYTQLEENDSQVVHAREENKQEQRARTIIDQARKRFKGYAEANGMDIFYPMTGAQASKLLNGAAREITTAVAKGYITNSGQTKDLGEFDLIIIFLEKNMRETFFDQKKMNPLIKAIKKVLQEEDQ